MSGQTISQPNDARAVEPRSLSTRAFVIYVAVFLIVWSLRATVFIAIDESIYPEVWRSVYSTAVKFIFWVVPVFILLAVLHLRPLKYLKLITPIDKRGLAIVAIVAAVWFSLTILGESMMTHRSPRAMFNWKSISLLGTLFTILSPIWEEILFRGFFLNRLNESLSFWRSNVLQAALFMLVHAPYWVSKNGMSGPVIKDLANVFLLGCLFGWAMKKTNSLWPAIGIHIANNLISGLIHS